MKTYLGVDLGTSSVKVLLVNEKGETINESTKSYPLLTPKSGWTEQNPNDWLEQSLIAIKEVIKGYEDNLHAISFSGQMHGLVILDNNDNVIRPAILWNDQRTVDEVNYLNNEIGKNILLEETGNIALTGFTLPKILWIKNDEPENFKKISKIMLPKDYLVYKLTNKHVSDVTDLSGTLLLDVKRRIYSNKMLDLACLTIDQLPEVLESTEIVGTLTPKIKDILNIKNDVLIIIGGGDQAIGAISTGIVRSGDINVSLGTSGVVFVASDNYSVDTQKGIHSFAHANGKYHLMGVTLSAAGSLSWFKHNFYKDFSYDEIFAEISSVSIDEELYFLPYLSGERSPINNPYARGSFVGLDLTHTRKEMGRALVEGVTFSLYHIYQVLNDIGISGNKIRLIGGGAKSEFWSQNIADMFNLEVEIIEIKEGPAFGAAIVAMVGSGLYEDLEEAINNLVKVKKIFYPNNERALVYKNKFIKYLEISNKLNDVFIK